jgi:RimJ/RimL family protein N-acetyltransferase
MKYYRKILGERLYLSPINSDEVDAYLKWMNEDKTLTVNFGQYPLMVSSKSDLNWLYEPPKKMHRFAIVLLDNVVLIGSISLHNIYHLNRNAYIAIFIGDEEHRSKGYGTEAIRLILNYGFKTMNLHSINLTEYADNYGGIKCYEKAGFREVGRLPEVFFINRKYVDKIYMSILESEFRG